MTKILESGNTNKVKINAMLRIQTVPVSLKRTLQHTENE